MKLESSSTADQVMQNLQALADKVWAAQ
jgi:hypothetical protein